MHSIGKPVRIHFNSFMSKVNRKAQPMDKMIYVSLIGDAIIANETRDQHAGEVSSVIYNQVTDKLSNLNEYICGEMRYTMKVRSAVVTLGK